MANSGITLMSASSRAAPLIERSVFGFAKRFKVEADFQALLSRMRQRLYPETIPVLASFWLGTLCNRGYRRRDWVALRQLLRIALDKDLEEGREREAVLSINSWITNCLVLDQIPKAAPPLVESIQTDWDSNRAEAYVVRLLNEWLPMEVARLLMEESEATISQDDDGSVLAIGRAINRLLIRQHPSRSILEMLLTCRPRSPEYVYPADLEVLQDVLLAQLGEMAAAIQPISAAILLFAVPDSRLPVNYSQALQHAYVVRQSKGAEIHVPISSDWIANMREEGEIRISSIIVTSDGQAWQAHNFEGGDGDKVVYRPAGRLRIDYSTDHATLRVPWPEKPLIWSGACHSARTFTIFGREWRVSKWELDAERSWLHLVFSRTLSLSEIFPGVEQWRLRPASVDMAWTSLGNAINTSLLQRSTKPIEHMRDLNLIPLGVAISRVVAASMWRRPPGYASMESELIALRNLEAPIVSAYGRVPWRILPVSFRQVFLKLMRHPAALQLLKEVFEAPPSKAKAR